MHTAGYRGAPRGQPHCTHKQTGAPVGQGAQALPRRAHDEASGSWSLCDPFLRAQPTPQLCASRCQAEAWLPACILGPHLPASPTHSSPCGHEVGDLWLLLAPPELPPPKGKQEAGCPTDPTVIGLNHSAQLCQSQSRTLWGPLRGRAPKSPETQTGTRASSLSHIPKASSCGLQT